VTARRLCPELIFVPARFDVYKAVSQQIRDIFREYTELVEPLSLDEAFLDVTHERSATLVAREIKARIRENLAQLDVEVDSNRLEQEMIFYLEKLDITEEKVRLQNHCRYFRAVAADEETPGRKLGFIAQEMGREINTMGSKANESNIQILVVKMKDELEKIKEQVLNIL